MRNLTRLGVFSSLRNEQHLSGALFFMKSGSRHRSWSQTWSCLMSSVSLLLRSKDSNVPFVGPLPYLCIDTIVQAGLHRFVGTYPTGEPFRPHPWKLVLPMPPSPSSALSSHTKSCTRTILQPMQMAPTSRS